ncbi:MAG TPA: esterase-like activity of phytase family protein [Thermoanaerobaculia bacterium]|jgi:hypothetical protein|nr:esterase-like activity of phytase family protein [Thermoanaerobaculia bacterium]
MQSFLRRRVSAIALLVLSAQLAILLAACRPAALTTIPAAALAGEPPVVRFVAHAQLPTSGTKLDDLDVGGLSGLAYDRAADLFYAVVDDPTGHPPARLLRFRWHPPAVPDLVDWLELADQRGPLPTAGADLEGVARTAAGELFVSSEGDVKGHIAPWVGDFDPTGHLRRRLPLPTAFRLGKGHGTGHNQGFEALMLAPSGDALFAGAEGPLAQDQPPPADELRRVRVLRWDLRGSALPRQWLYPIDPQHAKPIGEAKFGVAGLVDLLPFSPGVSPDVSNGHLLALERSYVDGVGFAVKLFEASLAGADEVTGADSVAGRAVHTIAKRKLADFADLGVPIANYEGLAWGPAGEDGAPLLVAISDNNFNAPEGTNLAAFALAGGAVTPGGRASSSSPSSPRTRR